MCLRMGEKRLTGEPMLVMTEIMSPLIIAMPYGLEVNISVDCCSQSVVLIRKLRS